MAELGLRQTALAARAQMPHQSIYKILHGLRVPSLTVLDRIAKALDCSADELLSEASNEKSPLSRRELQEIVSTAVEIQKQKQAFAGFTKATPLALSDLVSRFGGWNFLFEYLQEELEIRAEAERDYQRLRDSIQANASPKDLSIAKNKMLISRMIAKTGRDL